MSSENTRWKGKERRNEDVEGVVTPQTLATRAAREGLNADQMFEQHEDPAQNHVRPEDFKNPELRSEVEVLLRTAVIDGLVDAQCEGSLDTLKTFNLYNPEQPQEGDVPAPTLEQAKEILATQVTPEQLEVIKQMQKPTLQLIPVTSMDRYIEALDSHKPMDDQDNAYVSPWHKEAFERADKRDGVTDNTIIGWRIAVTEGLKEPKLLEGDDLSRTLRNRNAWLQRIGVSGVDLKRMLLLMMNSLKTEKPVDDYWKDDGTFTFVNEEGERNGRIAGVAWLDIRRQVWLFDFPAGDSSEKAGLRASVMVDVPKS